MTDQNDTNAKTFPAGKVLGPIAGTETAEDALWRLHDMGLIATLVPLDSVQTYLLTRDRMRGDDPELAELMASLRELGLSHPIRLEARRDGQYELIEGFRRLSAFRALLTETGDVSQWGAIPAIVMPRGETVATLYRRMVDENMVRKDISFAEMAQLAIAYAAEPSTDAQDAEKAVGVLFRSARYSKRSHIRGFLRLMEDLGEHLKFAAHIPRDLGLKLSEALAEEQGLAAQLRLALRGMDNRSVQDELALLRGALDDLGGDRAGLARSRAPGLRAVAPGGAKAIFPLETRFGVARCTAGQGVLTIRMQRDFTGVDRQSLEAALRSMLDTLR